MKGFRNYHYTPHFKRTPSFQSNGLEDIADMIHTSFPALSVETYTDTEGNITALEYTNSHNQLLAIQAKKQQQRYNVEFFENAELLIPENIPDHLAQPLTQGQGLYECHKYQIHDLMNWFAFSPTTNSIKKEIRTLIE